MVNDIAVTHNNRWKYVDDISLSETIIKGEQSQYKLLSTILRNGVQRMIWYLTTPNVRS